MQLQFVSTGIMGHRKSHKVSRAGLLGITLIELLLVLVLVGVLATSAVPTFKQWITSMSVRSASAQIASLIVLARSEALLRKKSFKFFLSGNTAYVCEVTVATETCDTVPPAQITKSIALKSHGYSFVQTSNLDAGLMFSKTGRVMALSDSATILFCNIDLEPLERFVDIDLMGRPLVREISSLSGGCV